MIKCG